MHKKPKDLSASEGEERDHGEGRDVYVTLFQSDTVQSYGRVKVGTSPVGVELCKKPKDLCASERGTWTWGGCEYGGCMYVKVQYVRILWYVHERRPSISDGQPSSRSCRNSSTSDHDLP